MKRNQCRLRRTSSRSVTRCRTSSRNRRNQPPTKRRHVNFMILRNLSNFRRPQARRHKGHRRRTRTRNNFTNMSRYASGNSNTTKAKRTQGRYRKLTRARRRHVAMHRVIRNLILPNLNIRRPRRRTRRRRRNRHSPRITRQNFSSILRHRTRSSSQGKASSSIPTRYNMFITAPRANFPVLTIPTRRTTRPVNRSISSIVARMRSRHRFNTSLSSNNGHHAKVETRRRVTRGASVHTKKCQRVFNRHLGSTRGSHLRGVRGPS